MLVRMLGAKDSPGAKLLVNLFWYLESFPGGGSSERTLLAVRAHAHIRVHLVSTKVHCTATCMGGKVFTRAVLRAEGTFRLLLDRHLDIRGQVLAASPIEDTLS